MKGLILSISSALILLASTVAVAQPGLGGGRWSWGEYKPADARNKLRC